MSIAGAWRERSAGLLLALLTIRASGWWDAFSEWRSERDKEAWRSRQAGTVKELFRNKRGRAQSNEAAA